MGQIGPSPSTVDTNEVTLSMKATAEILQLLRDLQPELEREFGVKRLAIFGSYARRDQSEDSDVDVLVDVPPSIGLRFVDLAETIESLLGIRAEVVSRGAITARNWKVIEKELIDVQ